MPGNNLNSTTSWFTKQFHRWSDRNDTSITKLCALNIGVIGVVISLIIHLAKSCDLTLYQSADMFIPSIPANTRNYLQSCNFTSELVPPNEKYSWEEKSHEPICQNAFIFMFHGCFSNMLTYSSKGAASTWINVLHAAEKLRLRTKAQSPDPKPKQRSTDQICMSESVFGLQKFDCQK